MDQVPQAAIDRWAELQAEQSRIEKGFGQIGTAIPNIFGFDNTFLINPSNVGVGVIARMLETDDTVSAAAQFKILMILAKIGEYHNDDPKIKQFVQDYLDGMQKPTWQEAKEGMASAKGFGYSVSEVNFGLDEQLRKIPTQIITYHPSTLAFEVDQQGFVSDEGILQFVTQHNQLVNPNKQFPLISHGAQIINPFVTPNDRLLPRRTPFLHQFGVVRIPRNKCIHHVNNPAFSFGSPYGKSEVRAAHLAWQIKQYIMKQMGISAKRDQKPFLVGHAPMGQAKLNFTNTLTGETEELTPAQAMQKMLADRQEDDAVVIGPKDAGYEITSIEGSGSLDGYVAAINALNTWIFRAFLMPSLIMSEGTAGSRSLGDKHFQIVDRICEAEALKFGQTIINDMIRRNIEENFGPQKNYGEFKQRPQNLAERQIMASMFSELVLIGVLKPHIKDDMIFIRESLGLPPDKDVSFDITGGEEDEDPNDPDLNPPKPGSKVEDDPEKLKV